MYSPLVCAQELQLLTAKADLEAQVQRLRLQAERKGVHLETGEDSRHSSRSYWLPLCPRRQHLHPDSRTKGVWAPAVAVQHGLHSAPCFGS
jgi:hypothetical protein